MEIKKRANLVYVFAFLIAFSLTSVAQAQHSSWHNFENRSDINGDGHVTPLDINILNAVIQTEGFGRIDFYCNFFYDVNQDGFLNPTDLNILISDFNNPPQTNSYHNYDLPEDADGDGRVTFADVQKVAYWADRQPDIMDHFPNRLSFLPYLDVNDDGRVDSRDYIAIWYAIPR